MWVLLLLDVRHCCKLPLYAIPRKTNEPNLRKQQKPNFRPNFGGFGTNLGPKKFFVGFTSTYAISKKSSNPNLRKLWKTSLWAWFRPVGPKIRPQIFFFWIWLLRSLDIMISYHHVQYQKKVINQSWEDLVTDRRTNKQMDALAHRQTDKWTKVIS